MKNEKTYWLDVRVPICNFMCPILRSDRKMSTVTYRQLLTNVLSDRMDEYYTTELDWLMLLDVVLNVYRVSEFDMKKFKFKYRSLDVKPDNILSCKLLINYVMSLYHADVTPLIYNLDLKHDRSKRVSSSLMSEDIAPSYRLTITKYHEKLEMYNNRKITRSIEDVGTIIENILIDYGMMGDKRHDLLMVTKDKLIHHIVDYHIPIYMRRIVGNDRYKWFIPSKMVNDTTVGGFIMSKQYVEFEKDIVIKQLTCEEKVSLTNQYYGMRNNIPSDILLRIPNVSEILLRGRSETNNRMFIATVESEDSNRTFVINHRSIPGVIGALKRFDPSLTFNTDDLRAITVNKSVCYSEDYKLTIEEIMTSVVELKEIK